MRPTLNATVLLFAFFFLFLGISSVCTAAPPPQGTSKVKTYPSSRAKSYYEQAKSIQATNPRKALILAKKALSVTDPDDEPLRFTIIELLGDINSDLGQHQQALDFYQQCLNSSSASASKVQKASILRSIGICYYYMGIPEKALKVFTETLVLGEEVNSADIIAAANNNIGLTYLESAEYDKAREFFFRASKFFEKAGSREKVGYALLNIGNSFYSQDNNDKALEYYQQAYRIAAIEKDQHLTALTAQNLALVAEVKENRAEALGYSLKALGIYREFNDQLNIAGMLSNIGSLLTDWGKPAQAEPYLHEALKISLQLESLPALEKCYNGLASLYELKKDYPKALDYYKKGNALTDSLYNSDRSRLLLEMQTKYQVTEKEKENKLLRIILLISVPLGTLLLVVIFIAFLIKHRSNRLLDEKNKQIEIQNKKLEEANDTKNLFFSILGHDLKNSLGGFVTFSQLLSAHGDEFSEAEKQRFYVEMKRMAENLYNLLENLLEWARTQTGALKVTTSTFPLADIIHDAQEPHRSMAKKKRITIAYSLIDSLTITSDRNLLATILRNLIGNAVKYTRPEGKIEIAMRERGNSVEISISDHGVGIPEEIIDQLFRIDNKYRTQGTENEPGTGLGLILCREFTQMIGGTIGVTSKLGQGSTFTVSLPARFQLPD